MKNQKRVTRREALKKMGISALALTGGAQAVALLTQSCSNTNGETFPLKADLNFTAEWTRILLENLSEQAANPRLNAVNMRAVMRRCSRMCYDKSHFDELIKENDLEDFLRTAHAKLGWSIDYNEREKKMIVYENNTACLCPLSRACQGKVSANLCTCTETELERILSRAYGGGVSAKVLQAVLKGDKTCVYEIKLL